MGVVLGRVRVGVLFTLIHGGRRSRRETLRIGSVARLMKVVAWGRRNWPAPCTETARCLASYLRLG